MAEIDNDLFNAAVKALRASEKMSEAEYIKVKNHVMVECADLGEEAQSFIQEFFKLADEKRAS